MLRITLVLFIVGEAVTQVVFRGPCPNPTTVQGFNIYKFNGKWFEYAKYGSKSNIESKCVTATHFPFKDGSFKIENSLTSITRKKQYSYEFTAKPVYESSNGRFTLTSATSAAAPYDILDTDYTSWALLWGCTNSGGNSIHSAWILTRSRFALRSVIDMALEAANKHKLYKPYFVGTDRTGCPNSY